MLIGRQLGSFRSLLVASPEYISKYGSPASPGGLSDHSCLGFTSHPDWPNWVLEKEDERVQVHPEGQMITNTSEALVTAVCRGVGIALLPEWMIRPHLEDGSLINVLSGWRSATDVSVYALMPPGTLMPVKTRVFINSIRAGLTSSVAWSR